MTTKSTHSTNDAAHSRTAPIDDNSRIGLALLSQAFTCALDAGADRWDFALEIDTLFAAGLTISDLRWLVAKRFAEHGQESSVYGSPHRTFRRAGGFFFGSTTCLILTPSGAAFAGKFLKAPVVSPRSVPPIETAALESGLPADDDQTLSIYARLKPFWNSSRRELSLDGNVIKRFRVRAQNQEVILSAFEEESWPKQIDDPLPVSRDIDPRTRLHDAINRLNRCQSNRLLRFRGNGAGTGVSWELRQTVVLHQTEISALRTRGFPTSRQTAASHPRRMGS
jgi:hypothetical protein